MGAILSDNPLKGAFAGGIAAPLAESMAEILSSNVEDTIKDIRAKAKEEGLSLSSEQVKKELEANLYAKTNIERLGASVVALLAEQDVDTSLRAAHNALDNNFIIAAVPYLIAGGMIAWSAYDIRDAYKQGGPEAALMQLGIEVGTAALGGVAGKTVFKVAGKPYLTVKAAVEVVLAKNPSLKVMLSDLVHKLNKYGEKFVEFDAKLGKALCKPFGKGNGTSILDPHISIPNGTVPGSIPSCVQSRINLRKGDGTNKNPGFSAAWKKHGNMDNANKSHFTISQEELKVILQDQSTVESTIGISPGSESFVREIDVVKVVGKLPLKKGGSLLLFLQ